METNKLIADVKKSVSHLSGEEKEKYISGLRDGLDIAVLICDDLDFSLASNKDLQDLLDFLDSEF